MARDIDEWLEGLRLGRYARAFADNEIDLDALLHITDEDLEKIGIALGARRKMLAAINEVGGLDEPATKNDGSGARPTSAEAERRQLTVMFCDLGGSTALSTRLDPEDYREVIGSYQDACANSVKAHGAMSPRSSGYWPISVGRRPTKMMPDRRSAPGSASSGRSLTSRRLMVKNPSLCASALPPAQLWLATLSVKAPSKKPL